ncbi:hypothetical protein [Salinicola endophyticus]|uniref:Uncharacterized protein n=1 Tax=Salinicola endophyticus TaxID=1949083 RepID=A0AB74U916_9GAMM
MTLLSIFAIAFGFGAFGLFVALRLCRSDKNTPVARERVGANDDMPNAARQRA